jgi:FtsP/CotA-like multicopper oxidase with cupredoxin domain
LFGGAAALMLLAGALACTPPPPPRQAQPEGWKDGIGLPELEDTDADPEVVTVSLEARLNTVELVSGTSTVAWTYNGLVPGPVIRARIGQTLVVNFTNSLPEPTTVHWHGIRVPSGMDGTEVSQTPTPPRGTFVYRFELKDAGTYWYHSHINSSLQVGHGMYGMLVVEEREAKPQLGDDLPLVFSDISLAPDGSVLPADTDGALGGYFGREGNVALLNGRVQPKLKARVGVPQRWRMLNAARTRFLQVRVPRATVVRIGSDGGLIPLAEPLDVIRLVPGERMEVWVRFDSAGPVEVVLEDANRLHLPGIEAARTLINVDVVEGKGADIAVPTDGLGVVDAIELAGALERELIVADTSIDGQPVLTINGKPAWDAPPIHISLGSTEVWKVVNNTDYDHPMHLHGYFFQMIDRGGKAWPRVERKDTVNLPRKSSMRFAVRFDDRPGMWMFHCHILDHVDLGMMVMLHVE